MLQIEKNIENDHSVLSLIGEIDASNSVELDEVILEMVQGGVRNLLVDCENLEYISSAGLGVFMSYLEEFQEKEIRLVIFGLKEKVFQVFNILGLDQLMKIKSTKQDALDEII
ncbi:STAS domain-containing protein [Aquiflexum sp.]|uniref:STAS domain-containing protein n=1 Tax=Aquiflexum sp. TaxID=1872584 RepID=UPI003593F0E5